MAQQTKTRFAKRNQHCAVTKRNRKSQNIPILLYQLLNNGISLQPTTSKLLASGSFGLLREVFPTQEQDDKQMPKWEKVHNVHENNLDFSRWRSNADLNEDLKVAIPAPSTLQRRYKIDKTNKGETMSNDSTDAPHIATQTLICYYLLL